MLLQFEALSGYSLRAVTLNPPIASRWVSPRMQNVDLRGFTAVRRPPGTLGQA